jgi:uncharacterized coiled-coil protein SlyX
MSIADDYYAGWKAGREKEMGVSEFGKPFKAGQLSDVHQKLLAAEATLTTQAARIRALEAERDEEARNHDVTYQKLIEAGIVLKTRAEAAEVRIRGLEQQVTRTAEIIEAMPDGMYMTSREVWQLAKQLRAALLTPTPADPQRGAPTPVAPDTHAYEQGMQAVAKCWPTKEP